MFHLILPCVVDVMKHPIWWPTEGFILQPYQKCWELPYQVIECNPLRWVMAQVHVSLFVLFIIFKLLFIVLQLLWHNVRSNVFQKWGAVWWFTDHLKVLWFELIQLVIVQSTNWLRKISPSKAWLLWGDNRFLLWKFIVFVISNNPRKDRVLSGIIERTTCSKVQKHKIFCIW